MYTIKTSEKISTLIKSLRLVQSSIENVTKDKKNDFFKSKYADLSSVLDTIKPLFVENGLSYSQHPSLTANVVNLETVIFHDSGEWMSSVASAPVAKQDPQGVGSAITYLRRYALSAIVGITQEDDDGNSASNNKDKHVDERWKKFSPPQEKSTLMPDDPMPDFSVETKNDLFTMSSAIVSQSDILKKYNRKDIRSMSAQEMTELTFELDRLFDLAKKDASKQEILAAAKKLNSFDKREVA